MTKPTKELADRIADEVMNTIERERRINRDDLRTAAVKAIAAHECEVFDGLQAEITAKIIAKDAAEIQKATDEMIWYGSSMLSFSSDGEVTHLPIRWIDSMVDGVPERIPVVPQDWKPA